MPQLRLWFRISFPSELTWKWESHTEWDQVDGVDGIMKGLAKNVLKVNASWARVLSWRRLRIHDYKSGCFLPTESTSTIQSILKQTIYYLFEFPFTQCPIFPWWPKTLLVYPWAFSVNKKRFRAFQSVSANVLQCLRELLGSGSSLSLNI